MKSTKKKQSEEREPPLERYIIRVFYCENCGKEISSYQNAEGVQKISCEYCGTRYVRTFKKTRRCVTSKLYPPDWVSLE